MNNHQTQLSDHQPHPVCYGLRGHCGLKTASEVKLYLRIEFYDLNYVNNSIGFFPETVSSHVFN